MISIHRCAACGSQSVVYDTKNEGFSVGKAVVGTIVFGYVGAVAGINGKKRGYYNCGACGTSLSYCMPDSSKDIIDRAISKPNEHINLLIDLKKKYPNIEWEAPSNISVQTQTTAIPKNRKPSDREIANAVYEYYIKNNIKETNGSDSIDTAGELVFSQEVRAYSACSAWLESKGLFTSESYITNDIERTIYKFLSDPAEIREAKNAFMIKKEAKHLLDQNREYIYGVMHSIFAESKTLHKDEVANRIAPILLEDGLTDNIAVLDVLLSHILSGLSYNYLDEQYNTVWVVCAEYDKENSTITIVTDPSEVSQRMKSLFDDAIFIAKKWDRIPLDKEKVHNALERTKCEDMAYLESEIMNKLAGDKVYCTKDMQIELGCGEDYFKPIANVLQALEKEGITEKKIERRITYYVLKGGFDRNEEKKKREAIAANNRVINDKISALEAEKAQKQAIYEEFKSKIFGEGARKKKEAQQRIIQIDTEIANLKRQLR